MGDTDKIIASLRKKVCARVEKLDGGWCELARLTGHDRTSLWRSFKQTRNNPSLGVVLDVLPHLGLRFELLQA